jgi:hypothetical protein
MLRVVLYPAIAVAFSLTIITAYVGLRAVPAAMGWASVVGFLAAGAAALALTRSTPEWGATLGGVGVAVVAYVVGLIACVALNALFAKPQR